MRIDQVIYVQRDSQKAIVLGEGGRRSRRSAPARAPSSNTCSDRRVHLFLFVKVRENWIEDRERYAALGSITTS